LKLVIVESPAKAKTISRFLGKEYKVMASYGHIRDLPSSAEEIPPEYKDKPWATLAVDTDNGFAPIYVVPKESKKALNEIKKALKEAEEVVLATDEDREGESISWHLLETLKPKVPVKRIAFHEITKSAILEALANPRGLDMELVNAQESRRIVDRLFGYSLSPLLWKKVRPKLSAGRVQSVAVRLVVEREEERKAFKTARYWSIEATLSADGKSFGASLISLNGKRLATGKDFDPATGLLKTDAKTANEVIHLLEDEAQRTAQALFLHVPWRVASLTQKKTRQSPAPPFITSTLQQAASSILNLSPRRTMQIAQKLYEGVDIGGGEREGLITYMRTDSVTLSENALAEAGQVIRQLFGPEYYQGPRRYVTKSKNAQEAHEAIRPTHLHRHPDSLRAYLAHDELTLYQLIWNRTIASQMPDAEILKTTVDFEVTLENQTAILRANGSVVSFPGFLRAANGNHRDTELPPLAEGQHVGPGEAIELQSVEAEAHQTVPPPRYTEASLIQRLEEEGIGRPSTYAPTISTIEQRGYVERVGKTLVPTFLAVAVISLLRKHFQEYVDLGFTARMEDALDEISNGRLNSKEFLAKFYRGNGNFGDGLLPQIEKELPKMEFPVIPVGQDPQTGDPIIVRLGKTSPYIQRGEGGAENTVPIPREINYEELTPDKALSLLQFKAKASEALGRHPETGENIYLQIGPYGPYVQQGETGEGKKKPKRASLPKGMSLSAVTLDIALRLLSLPRELGRHPENGETITAAVGRFGPYVKCGNEFRSLDVTDDVYTISLERALELLAQPKKSRRKTKTVLATLGSHPETGNPIELCDGRYGPFVTDGKINVSVPKDIDPHSVTLEQALDFIAQSPKSQKTLAKKPTASRSTATKTSTKKTTAKKSSAKTTAGKSKAQNTTGDVTPKTPRLVKRKNAPSIE